MFHMKSRQIEFLVVDVILQYIFLLRLELNCLNVYLVGIPGFSASKGKSTVALFNVTTFSS
jgi:hypothetical protein